jgi:hypothetical protein
VTSSHVNARLFFGRINWKAHRTSACEGAS